MLHVCVHRFDVMGTVEFFLGTKRGLRLCLVREFFLDLANVAFLLLFSN